MHKKLLIIPMLIATAVLSFVYYSGYSNASDWPSRNLNQTLNRHITDPGVVGSSKMPFEIEVAHNTQDMVAGGGYFYYTDGASQSTIYAVNMAQRAEQWSKKYPAQITKLLFQENRIYFGADKFYCLNYQTGEEIWSTSPGATWKAKVYQFDSNFIYGVGFQSNVQRLITLNIFTGEAKNIPDKRYSDNIIDIGVWHGFLYLSLGRGGVDPSGSIEKVDLESYNSQKTSQLCRSSSTTMIIDGENNQVVLTASNAAICSYKLDDLSAIAVNRMENLERFVKYNNRYYSVWDDYSKSMPADNTLAGVSKTKVLGEDSFQSDPIIVNEVFYAATSGGAIWSKNLETFDTKYSVISEVGIARRLIYSDGYLITLLGYKDVTWKAKVVFSDINNIAAAPNYQISVASPYKTGGMNQYLGQLHCHAEIERPLDWSKTIKFPPSVWDVEKRYEEAGYDFIALTEHNRLITDPGVDGILHIVDSEEITQGTGGNHILAVGINDYVGPEGSDQERIDAVNNQSGLPILAHPNSNSYPFSLKQLNESTRYSLIEIFNTAVDNWRFFAGSGYALDKWDRLLSTKKVVYGTSNDDYTPYDAGFDGAAVVVFAPSNSQEDIMLALKSGNFYAVQGSNAPRLNVDLTESSFVIHSDQDSMVRFIGAGGTILKQEKGVIGSSYTFTGNETYIRAEIESVETGKRSWTQPIFVNSAVNYSNLSIGEHSITTKDALFKIDTSGEFSLSSVNVSDLPETLPPSGHLSSIYSLDTTGEVNEGNTITYSYKNVNLPVNEEQLRIFTFNDQLGRWDPVISNIDYTAKTVTAFLPHFSLYTLSAELPEDSQAPSVLIISPTELQGLSGEILLEAEANDNQAVTAVRFILDNKDIGSDINSEDGWGMLFDSAGIVAGEHELLIEAEDFAGNIGSASYTISINSDILQPTITITTPLEDDNLKDVSTISGSFTSDLEVEAINLYLDDVYIDQANIVENQFSKDIGWSQFVDGEHIVKVELTDKAGNIAVDEIGVNVGENITATIISPKEQSYLRGSQLLLQVDIVPQASVEIYMDGNLIENNSALDLLNYSLGDHLVEVKHSGEVIASAAFTITTNYQDTISTVRRLEVQDCFKNHGIPTAIIAQLRVAELAHLLKAQRIEKIILNNLEQFIELQSGGRKPKINERAKIIISENLDHLGIKPI